MVKWSVVILSLAGMVGCQSGKPAEQPKTQFAKDYADMEPLIKQCHAYYNSDQHEEAKACLISLTPLANKTVNEANEGDDQLGTQNAKANWMSADLNNLSSQIILEEMDRSRRGYPATAYNIHGESYDYLPPCKKSDTAVTKVNTPSPKAWCVHIAKTT